MINYDTEEIIDDDSGEVERSHALCGRQSKRNTAFL
jgi:hypothetical protein